MIPLFCAGIAVATMMTPGKLRGGVGPCPESGCNIAWMSGIDVWLDIPDGMEATSGAAFASAGFIVSWDNYVSLGFGICDYVGTWVGSESDGYGSFFPPGNDAYGGAFVGEEDYYFPRSRVTSSDGDDFRMDARVGSPIYILAGASASRSGYLGAGSEGQIVDPYSCPAVAWFAFASASLTIGVEKTSSPVVSNRGSCTYSAIIDPSPFFGSGDNNPKLLRTVLILASDSGEINVACGLLTAGNLESTFGLSWDAETATWLASDTFVLSGKSETLTVVKAQLSDGRFDVNGDGRFNAQDVPALESLFGTKDSEVIDMWDLDQSLEVDAGDVSLMQQFIDLGLDSGFLGDFDADGDVDCDDWSAMQPFPDAQLGDEDYVIPLDADLNGILDETDLAAIIAAMGDVNSNDLPDSCEPCYCGDIADPGYGNPVDLDDFTEFATCFGVNLSTNPQCVCADLDADGDVDLTDYTTLQTLYGTVNTNSPPDCL